MENRVNLGKAAPELYQAVADLNKLTNERAGLALVEAITVIAEGQLPDSVYAEAAAVLSEEEIAAIEWVAVVISAWNSISISSRCPVKP
jgi:alkylhydroperoxidase family enzyme